MIEIEDEIRLSAAVYPKSLALYQFFLSHHQHFIIYFFIYRIGSPCILPYIPL